MASKNEVFKLTIDVNEDIKNARSAADQLRTIFNQLNLTDNLKKGLDKTFSELEREFSNLENSGNKLNPFKNMKDIDKAEKSFDRIKQLMQSLVQQGKDISGIDLSKFLPVDVVSKLQEFNKQLQEIIIKEKSIEDKKITLEADTEKADNEVEKFKKRINDTKSEIEKRKELGLSTKTSVLTLDTLQRKLIDAEKQAEKAAKKLKEFNIDNTNLENIEKLRAALQSFSGDDISQIPTDLKEIQEYINNLQVKKTEDLEKTLEKIPNITKKSAQAFNGMNKELSRVKQEGQGISETTAEIERLGNQVRQFFSIGSTIKLFKNAVRDAMNTIKELDATMTETATVTDFSISDMWAQLPRYTDEANKLGTSINSLYKATTLYYQQGLDTNEAMALGIETIKMARVANMDAAQATDLMTAALRGFNMELNETSAIRVNDVYSELAAVTAADTDEIGIAISKTASIAHSANMEFETTAAFLSQIIETTREAPETAGTAMKTIIARFSEVKKLYSEGQITGTDEEGEVVNVNKIQEALRTVGIDMSKFFTGKEGLDQILLRLAEKWDTLDVVTQRYIATQAAGSRQQSRFLAMMSDYDRTLELVDAAYDSAGSGQAQFEKTLDSVQAKLSELKNAWDQFTMGIANSDFVKAGIDILTKLLSVINDIISTISGGNGLIKSITSIGASFLALRTGAKLFGSEKGGGIIGKFLGVLKGKDTINQAKKTGIEIGAQIGASIGQGINKIKDFKLDFSQWFTKDSLDISSFTKDQLKAVKESLGKGKSSYLQSLINKGDLEKANEYLDEHKDKLKEIPGLYNSFEKGCKKVGSALIGVGSIVSIVGGLISKQNETAGQVITTIGTIVTVLGSVVTIMPSLISGIKSLTATLHLTLPELGAIAAAITILISLFAILINNTPEKKLERAQKKAAESAKAAQETQQAYDDLLSNRNNYNELEEKVKSLTKGTQEWKDAVAELNSKVLELVQNYEGLEIVYDSEGNMSISKESWDKVEQQQKTKTDKATATALSDRINSAKTKLNNTQNNNFAYNRYKNNITGEEKSYADIMYEMGANENTVREEIEDYISKNYKIAPSLNVDTREAEKELEIARKNMILAFMPESADKAEANQVGKALTTLIGDAIDDESDPEEIQEIVDNYYNEFNKLTDDQKALLSGNFGAVSSDKVDTSNIEDREIKEKVEEQRILYEKSLRDARDELQRLTDTWSTNFEFFDLDKDIALKLTEKTSSMGSSAAKAYYESWDKIRKENKDLAENLLDFGVTDFTSLTNLTDYIREQGLDEDLAEEYWRAMVDGAEGFTITYGQIATWSESIKNSMKETVELIDRLESGKLSAEDLTALQNVGLDTSNRLLTPDGYKVYGIDSQEARRALNQKNAEKAQADLDTLNGVGEDIQHLSARDQREVDHYAEMLNLTKQKNETEEEFVKRIQEEWERARQIAEETNDYAQASVYTADEQAARGGTAQQIRYSAMQEASDAGLDVDELITYSEKLQELYGIEQSMADRIALDNMKMNASIKELADNWDEWGEALKNPDAGDYASTIAALQKNMRQMLGITADLSDDFLTNAENMDLMARAAEGDADAIDELRKNAAAEIALGVNYDSDKLSETEQNLLNALDSFDPNIEIDTTLDEAGLTEAFDALLRSGQMTAEEINQALEAIGFEPELTYQEMSLGDASRASTTGYVTVIEDLGPPVVTRQIPVSSVSTANADQMVRIPVINGKATKYKGGSKSAVNASNKSGGGKKGGGGGGGSKKQNNWKNPYDKYYNLTEKINEALRTREKIERDYDRILKRRERTAAELLNNSAQEIANLRQEVQYQKRLQAGRREQIQNVAGERYDNGDQITTFEKMGVTKYANYNFDTQTIEIDWAAIEAVRDEELGKAIEAYVGRLEELQGQYEETQDTIEEMEDNIWEINQRGKEEYLSFEQRVLDALIAADQKIIDDLSAKFEGINSANDKILNSMQEQIDLERQIRDNTKTEDDIAQKEARLAYLRRDTSGANATEIMKLEQELADARQNYTDTLIDQGLQKLSDENQRAAEQRQEQIDIMQSIHDWTVESGGFNQKAEELINEAAAAGVATEAIETLLKNNEGWTSMTKFAGEKWMTDLANEYKAAMEGMSNFKVDEAKTKNTSSKNTLAVTDANGKNQQSVWFDSSKNRWVDSKGNLYDIYYDPTANNGQGGYKYSNKSTAEDENAWLKQYLDSIAGSLGNLGSSSSSGSGSGSGGGSNGGYKPPTTPTTKYKFSEKIGDYTFSGSGYTSKTAAAAALRTKVSDKMKVLSQSSGYWDANQWAILSNWYNQKIDFTKYIKAYKTGGLNTQTGPAWLDGTKAHPELVLNARDTENFIQLKDILSGMGSLDKLQNGGDNYYNFDIKVDQLASDYDVDKLIGKIKNEIDKDARYRNVNSINFIR